MMRTKFGKPQGDNSLMEYNKKKNMVCDRCDRDHLP